MSKSKIFWYLFLTIVLNIFTTTFVSASVFINEVMSKDLSNKSWVELYTPDSGVDTSNYILTTNYNAQEACSVVVNNNYVYKISGDFTNNFLLLEDVSINFLNDLSLYLVDCGDNSILSSLFVPKLSSHQSQARLYDGSKDAEVRSYLDTKNDTKGTSNNVVPVVTNYTLDKINVTQSQVPKLTFDLKAEETSFEGISIYLNGYLIKSFNTYQESYEYLLKDVDYFFVGSNLIKIKASSVKGSNEYVIVFNYQADKPTIKINTINNTSFSKNVEISGVVASNQKISNISLFYKQPGQAYKEYQNLDISTEGVYRKVYSFNFAPDAVGKYTIKVVVKDALTEAEEEYFDSLLYDPLSPKVDLSISPDSPDGSNNFYTSIPEIKFNVSDDDVSTIYYKWEEESAWITYDGKFEAFEGVNTLYYKTIDKAGNQSKVNKKEIKVDTIAPDVYIELFPELPDGLNGFYLEKPEILFKSSFDDIDKFEYSYNKNDWEEYKDNFVAQDTNTKFYYRAIDKASNKSVVGFFNIKSALEKPSVVKSIDYRLEDNGSVMIRWRDYQSNEAYLYEIYRSKDPNLTISRVNFYSAVPANQSYYIDSKVEPGATYYYLLVKKGISGKFSDPVRFEVKIPAKNNVLGAKSVAKSIFYVKDGPVVKTEKPFVINEKGEVLGAKTHKNSYTYMFFVSFSVFVFLLMKLFYKIRVQNAS